MLFGIEATELLEKVSFFDHRRSDKYLVDVAKRRHGCRNDNKRHGEHADQCSVDPDAKPSESPTEQFPSCDNERDPCHHNETRHEPVFDLIVNRHEVAEHG